MVRVWVYVHLYFSDESLIVSVIVVHCPVFNSFPPGQHGRHFADYIFRLIFVNEKFCILIKKNSLKFVPEGLIGNISALV